jgi:hypothetical protein
MIVNWKPDSNAPIWGGQNSDNENFFKNLKLNHIQQIGPSCVATTLTMIARSTGADVTVDYFKRRTNSQSPQTWSDSLKPFGMQLAYCNVDLRRIEYYIDDLISHDDLFLISFYSTNPPSDPDRNGKLCTAHIVTMHRDKIYDTAKSINFGGLVKAHNYSRLERQTKRIFRVVPLGHPRCL